jgi:hypothetical protein
MSPMLRCVLAVSVSGLLLGGCRTLNQQADEKPEITRDMPIEDAYGLAVQYGGDILKETKDLARDRQQLAEVQKLASADLLLRNETLSAPALTHVAHLYRVSSPRLDPQLFLKLMNSRQDAVRRIALRLAAVKPSTEVAQALEGYLSDALARGRDDEVLSSDLAVAIQENGLKSAYTFLVRGLMVEGLPEYANAMLALDPGRAAVPFLDYLGKADLEDLRQLNQKSVNVYTCTVIFRFLLDNPLPINHPSMPALFTFAVSRNRALAEMANAVLEKHIPEHRLALALMLARTPVQVQVAFVENTQKEMTAHLRLLLNELKELTQQKEVLEELSSQQGPSPQ